MPNFLIVDFFNIVKRYTFLIDDTSPNDGEFYSDISTKVVNKLVNIILDNNIDLCIVCSDLGYNARANSLLGGEYKANRKRARSISEEEREKDYISKLKGILQSMPCMFIEVNNVEADNIIYFLISKLRKLCKKGHYYVLSSDSDFLQLLDDDVSIINLGKKITVTVNNWKELYGYDSKYLKPKDYALLKSMVGDTSDNIKGVKGLGWVKVMKILNFLYTKLNGKVELENIRSMRAYFEEIKNDENSVPKEVYFCEKIIKLLDDNAEMLNTNFNIISLDMLETPYVARIASMIETSLETPISFSKREFLEKLKFVERFSNEVDYKEIVDKNTKLLYLLGRLRNRSEIIRKSLADSE